MLLIYCYFNIISDFEDELYFPHKLLLANSQPSKIRKSFGNSSIANIKFSKTQLYKMLQLGEFLVKLVRLLIKPG